MDAEFWYLHARSSIEDGQKKLQAAGERIEKLSLWLWGVFMASAAVGFQLAARRPSNTLVALSSATALAIIAVYWFSTRVSLPIVYAIDWRSRTEIEWAYSRGILERKRRLGVAYGLSGVAVIVLAITLAVAGWERSPDVTSLECDWNQSREQLSVLCTGIGKAPATLRLLDSEDHLVFAAQYIPLRGTVQTCIALDQNQPVTRVEVEWVGGDIRSTLSRPVSAK